MSRPNSIAICQFGFLRSELDNLPSTLNLTNRGQYATSLTSVFDVNWNQLYLRGPLIIHARAFTCDESLGWLEGEPAPRELHSYHDEGAVLVIPEDFSGILTKPIPPYVYAYCAINKDSWATVLSMLCPMQEAVANTGKKIVRDIAGAKNSLTWDSFSHRINALYDMLTDSAELRAHLDSCAICQKVFSIVVNRPPGA